MDHKFLKIRGALNEAEDGPESLPSRRRTAEQAGLNALRSRSIPRSILELVPESVARENQVIPLYLDGDTVWVAIEKADNIPVLDKLSFILSKSVRGVAVPAAEIRAGIEALYGDAVYETASVESMLAEFADSAAIDYTGAPSSNGVGVTNLTREIRAAREAHEHHSHHSRSGPGMLYYTVREGDRVLMVRKDGTMEIVVGPRRVWMGSNKFERMGHHVAFPDQFLVVRYRDGRREHVPGPAELWLDPRVHHSIATEDGLQIAAKEAVVIYTRPPAGGEVTRHVVHGPSLFVPQPGEWLHTFSWHASKGGSRGVQKVPNALVFQKLWMMPDQMYHDVKDVRTSDDAVLMVRLMIFFELVDIDRMLDATHDPIGDFVNAATSDVVAFVGRHDFEAYKRVTTQLNDLETYAQLTGRAAQCGYRINKVVYRGYDTAPALQQMHDQAIEARTRLQLDRATEQQAQELEDFKLQSQLARSHTRRDEQTAEVEHDLELARRKQEAELQRLAAKQESARVAHKADATVRAEIRQQSDTQQRKHLSALRDLGVDLTAYLTQGRADHIVELRGRAGAAHLHLDAGNGVKPKADDEGA